MPDTMSNRRRQAALAAMGRFADKHGCMGRNWLEVAEGENIALVGFTDSGARFTVAYQKQTDREREDHV